MYPRIQFESWGRALFCGTQYNFLMSTSKRQTRIVLGPHEVVLDGEVFERGKILKKDFFSTNVLLHRGEKTYVMKISHFNFFGGRFLRSVARLLSQRESSIYLHLQGLVGIPEIWPVIGRNFFLHEYI